MAMMKTVEDVEAALKEAGAHLIRQTTSGHFMYELAGHRLLVPGRTTHAEYRSTKNLIAQVKRAIRDSRALGPGVVPVAPGAAGGPPTPPGDTADMGVAIPIATPPPPATNIEPAPAPELAPAGPEEDPMAKQKYRCPECGVNYNGPQAVGRHRSMAHGIKGTSRGTIDYQRLKARADAKSKPPAAPVLAKPPVVAQGQALEQVLTALGLLTEAVDALAKEHTELQQALGPLLALARRKEG